jgi:hypothetical protein
MLSVPGDLHAVAVDVNVQYDTAVFDRLFLKIEADYVVAPQSAIGFAEQAPSDCLKNSRFAGSVTEALAVFWTFRALGCATI